MCFLPVITIVRPKLQKLRQIPMPHVQINRGRALTHSELIHSDCCIVDQLDPSDHPARSS